MTPSGTANSALVSSIAELRTLDKTEFSHALATGYYAAGDGGGGAYYLDPSDTISADNSGTVVVGTDNGRWKLIHQGAASVKQFGAKMDATTDDRTVVQAAIDAVSHIYFPPGTCKINSTLALRSGLFIELAPDAIIDFSEAAPGDTLFNAEGTLGDYVPLTADAVSGARTLKVGSTDGFAIGDWIKIKADTEFDPNSTHSKIGEISRIIEGYSRVTGDELTATSIPLVADLQDTYKTDASAGVAKLKLVENITIRGGNLRGNTTNENNQTAIRFHYTVNCRVENVAIEQFDAVGVLSKNSIGTTITGCRFANFRPTTTGYGVSFMDATADSIASHNHFDEVRHSLSTNNGVISDHGIPRRILFSNNTVRSSARSLRTQGGGDAIDTHTAAEDISIIGNTVLGSSGQGINVECPTAVIIGNTVNDAQSNGIAAHNEADHNGSIVIANNRVERCAERGIVVRQGGRGTKFAYTEIVVEGNTVEVAQKGIVVSASRTKPALNRSVSIIGNSVRDTQNAGIEVFGIRCGTITGNSLSKVAGIGIDAINIQSVSIGSNSVLIDSSSPGGIRLAVEGAGATSHCSIVGNTIALNSGAASMPSVELSDDVTHTAVVANVQRGTEGVKLGNGASNLQANNV